MLHVRTVAVIGAGAVGRGIAQQALVAGYQVILEDVLPSALRKAEQEIRTNLGAEAGGAVPFANAQAATERIQYAENVEDAARCADLVIETLPEELESKIEIFTLLDKICPPHTILATNTFSLRVTDIARVTYRPNKCIGIRFTNVNSRVELVEIVRTPETDDDTVAAAGELVRRMARKATIVREPIEVTG